MIDLKQTFEVFFSPSYKKPPYVDNGFEVNNENYTDKGIREKYG